MTSNGRGGSIANTGPALHRVGVLASLQNDACSSGCELDAPCDKSYDLGLKYRVTLVESEEGFAVWCDDLPGCNSQGETREEALANIKEAISQYLAPQPKVEKRFRS